MITNPPEGLLRFPLRYLRQTVSNQGTLESTSGVNAIKIHVRVNYQNISIAELQKYVLIGGTLLLK